MFSAKEISKISELRSVLSNDLLTKEKYSDDYYLIRWLRARNLDVQKAAQMLEKSIKWRIKNKVDEIIPCGIQTPLKYCKIYPTGVLGRDEEDNLVIVLPVGRFNYQVIMENEGMETALKYNTIWMENIVGFLKKIEMETGRKGLKYVNVLDMEGFSFRNWMYGPAREYNLMANQVFEENYPEMLKSMIIINAPKLFTIFWNCIKPFVRKETVEKVKIYGGPGGEEEKVWREVIGKIVGKMEGVPRRWGGTREGKDEFCSDDGGVWIDAPISLEFFTKGETRIPDGFKIETVKARDKHEVKVKYPDNIDKTSGFYSEYCPRLIWKLKVDSYDISFRIDFSKGQGQDRTEGRVENVYSEIRVNCRDGWKEGFVEIDNCYKNGEFILVFDNRYSYARSKTIHYSFEIISSTLESDRNCEINGKIKDNTRSHLMGIQHCNEE